MIPVTTDTPTPDIIAKLNKLAMEEVKGSARFKKLLAKRSTKRSTARRTK
jgi:hypothetical protein